jgi:hypothetical protein
MAITFARDAGQQDFAEMNYRDSRCFSQQHGDADRISASKWRK